VFRFALAVIPLFAQLAVQTRPVFDVASIKPSGPNTPLTGGFGNGQGGGRNMTLKMLIASAYRVQEFQITGGPAWTGSDRFDVEGKTEDRTADPDRLRLMLRSLMEDRFQLKLHREMREQPVYALVAAKGGLKIRPAADQTSPDVNGPSPKGAGPNRGAIRIGRGSLIGNAVTLSFLARWLSQRLDRLVIDRTGLGGRFDLQLTWTPDAGEVVDGPGGQLLPPAEVSGPSIFTAIQEQLGLKLESAKAPVEVLMIDRAERPSAN